MEIYHSSAMSVLRPSLNGWREINSFRRDKVASQPFRRSCPPNRAAPKTIFASSMNFNPLRPRVSGSPQTNSPTTSVRQALSVAQRKAGGPQVKTDRAKEPAKT